MILAIVGKTSSGKDTVAKHLSEKFNLPIVCSATTRPMRKYETNGKEHWFVSKEKMDEYRTSPNVIAYTKMPVTGIEYAATTDMVKGDDMIYIINPDGIRWFRENGTKHQKLVSIYIDLDNDEIIRRAILRGDNPNDIEARLQSENEEMNTFRDNKEYDYFLSNESPLAVTLAEADKIVEKIIK